MKTQLKKFASFASFTLIEVLVAMAVFSILILAIISLFNSAQKSWIYSSDLASMYTDAKVALDLISADLQCAYYGNNTAPFKYEDNVIAFISATPVPQSTGNSSKLFEVKYQRDSATGWLQRSVTGDGSNKWDWVSNNAAFDTSDEWKNVIPNVVDFACDCYDETGSESNNRLPYAVRIKLTLLGKNAWQKWAASGNNDILSTNQRKFTKTVIIGERGQ